jgi:hypothetical protein
MLFEEGPYVLVACFCEQVLEEKSGVLSLIRIVDSLERSTTGPAPPDEMPPVIYETNLVVMAKSGKARGTRTLSIEARKPSGALGKPPIELPIHFDGEEKGVNLIIRLNYTFDQEGLYWFNILLDDVKWTSIPFRVKYSRIATGGQALS